MPRKIGVRPASTYYRALQILHCPPKVQSRYGGAVREPLARASDGPGKPGRPLQDLHKSSECALAFS